MAVVTAGALNENDADDCISIFSHCEPLLKRERQTIDAICIDDLINYRLWPALMMMLLAGEELCYFADDAIGRAIRLCNNVCRACRMAFCLSYTNMIDLK